MRLHSPLHYAVLNGYENLIALFVEGCNVNVNQLDKSGFSPLDRAIEALGDDISLASESQTNIVRLLIENGARTSAALYQEIPNANQIQLI